MFIEQFLTVLASRAALRLWAATAMFVSVHTLTADTVATFPVNTIFENVAIGAKGNLFVSSINEGAVYEVSPEGSNRVFAQVPGPLLGLSFNTDGTLVGVGGTTLYRFDSKGRSSIVANVADAQDLNGVALLSTGDFLVTDDIVPTIWEIKLSTKRATAWLTSDLLAAPSGGLPIGANGIKVFQGAVYVSNTGAGTLVRIPVMPDGAAGTPEVYASSFQVDDFAFGSDGSIFAATQLGRILRLYPDGTRVEIPTGTLGDAAVAFGRTMMDAQDIYVVNNGGAFANPPDGPEPASVIRFATDTTGVCVQSPRNRKPVPSRTCPDSGRDAGLEQ